MEKGLIKYNSSIEAAFIMADRKREPIDPSVMESLGVPGAIVTTRTKPELATEEITTFKLRSSCDDTLHLASHIDWLLKTLRRGDFEKIETISSIYGSLFSCGIYIHRSGAMPSASLSLAQCRAVSALNAELDIVIMA